MGSSNSPSVGGVGYGHAGASAGLAGKQQQQQQRVEARSRLERDIRAQRQERERVERNIQRLAEQRKQRTQDAERRRQQHRPVAIAAYQQQYRSPYAANPAPSRPKSYASRHAANQAGVDREAELEAVIGEKERELAAIKREQRVVQGRIEAKSKQLLPPKHVAEPRAPGSENSVPKWQAREEEIIPLQKKLQQRRMVSSPLLLRED